MQAINYWYFNIRKLNLVKANYRNEGQDHDFNAKAHHRTNTELAFFTFLTHESTSSNNLTDINQKKKKSKTSSPSKFLLHIRMPAYQQPVENLRQRGMFDKWNWNTSKEHEEHDVYSNVALKCLKSYTRQEASSGTHLPNLRRPISYIP